MAFFEYHTTERDRVCRICEERMVRYTWGIVLHGAHVSPKVKDLHFHEGCFMRSLDIAKRNYATKKGGAE